MRRIRASIFSIISLIIVFFIITQAGELGAPGLFTLVGIVIIIFILLSLIRTWLRG